jgi:N-sulfoglucosamine sulfohydrolase-like protein
VVTAGSASGYNEEDADRRNVFVEWAPNRTKVKKGSKLARRRMIKRAVEESTRAIVSPEGWKLCLRDKDSNELYNLKEDPFETRNLYADAQYASIISRLANEIYQWQDVTKDKVKL